VYYLSGTLDFSAAGVFTGAARTSLSDSTLFLLVLFFVFGFAKAGVMPFHSWLPAAMVAPTPVSALLHAVAVVKVGAFSIVRVITGIFGAGLLTGFSLDTVILFIASVTILVSSAIALTQDELKRRLAFSTIGQLSYIILGVALLTPKGVTGGLLHIAMHAFGKITLFFCAGAIYVAVHEKKISRMAGIGRKMPITMTAFFIGSLSVIGLPPLGGFISKWHLVLGSMEAGRSWVLAVLLVSSFLNAAYFLPIVYRAFFVSGGEADFDGPVQEAPRWCFVPPVITAGISVILFFVPRPFLDLAGSAAQSLF
jgi:multicomponent Na+:H+ antiporter subunit D